MISSQFVRRIVSSNTRASTSRFLRASVANVHFTNKFNSTQAEKNDSVKYDIMKDGKRLSGEQFYENLKQNIAESQIDESLVPKTAFETVLHEYDVLMTESADFKDKYARSLAETENVRRRGVKQVDDAKQFAIQGFCKDLLEVADILDLAVSSVKKEDLEKANKEFKDLYDGLAMTKTVLHKTFSRHGLTVVNPENEKFDPNLHEAVIQFSQDQKADVAPGCIANVFKVGYSLKDRPIRAAQVGVVRDN